MKLKPTILPAKVLTDGTHRVRIAMSHRGNTRYFMTRFIVPSPNNLLGGAVIGIPNATYINQQLLKQMSDIYRAFDALEDTDYLTCSQLLERIENQMRGAKPLTIYEAMDNYLAYKSRICSKSSIRIISYYLSIMKQFFTERDLMKQLTTNKLFELKDFFKERNYNSTTQSMNFIYFRGVVAHAVRNRLVEYDVSPFRDFEMPKAIVRDVALTIEQLRQIRDIQLEEGSVRAMCRDFFMLSFYLCGMNLVDLLRLDFSHQTIRYLRQKTAGRRQDDQATEFTIQPEARAIIDKLYKNGVWANERHYKSITSVTRMINRQIKEIAEELDINRRVIFYSARKTFAQLSNELMIKESVIEYCIGDSVSSNHRVIGSYIKINRRMADAAVRKVFDAVASDKSMDQLIDEATA